MRDCLRRRFWATSDGELLELSLRRNSRKMKEDVEKKDARLIKDGYKNYQK